MPDFGSRKVLIVEDDLDYRTSLSTYLSAHGLTVATADDGSQAMEKLLFHRPGLVILDLMLPKVQGLEVLKRIREYPEEDVSKTPVVVLSNLSGTEDIEKAKELGCEDYLVKSQNDFEGILKVVREKFFGGGMLPNYEILDFTKPMK
ncbi:MAG: response regulator [Candidatus Doudnabacteria bacterium]|nr:response regulator [Candidatus Doudnabacteria bacterium]